MILDIGVLICLLRHFCGKIPLTVALLTLGMMSFCSRVIERIIVAIMDGRVM
jgi:hypothetical protein